MKTQRARPQQYYLKKFVDDLSAWLTQNRKCYQLSKLEIEIAVMKEMYTALGMHTCSEKTTF